MSGERKESLRQNNNNKKSEKNDYLNKINGRINKLIYVFRKN